MNVAKWIKENTESLWGKRIAITGSTGGLGVELCTYLAELGASLVLVDRNASRSEAHRASLEERFKGIEIRTVNLDLEDIVSARRAALGLIEIGVDVFIHNAGAYSIPRHKCKTGYDNVFQINFATPYYLIREIMPMLRERCGRVVIVGSIAHNYSKTDVNDIDFSKRDAASKVYGNAKRYLMFSLYELFRTEDRVKLSVTHPGITFTNITAHYPKLIFAIIKYPMKVIFMKPAIAALSVLRGVFQETGHSEWIGPRVFNVWGRPRKAQLRSAADSEIAKIAEVADGVYKRCAEVAEQ